MFIQLGILYNLNSFLLKNTLFSSLFEYHFYAPDITVICTLVVVINDFQLFKKLEIGYVYHHTYMTIKFFLK